MAATTTVEQKETLLAIAARFADDLRQRPGVQGAFLYGSLARGDLSPFSDVDVAVIYRDGSVPPYNAEHRLVDGVKVDAISFDLAAIRLMATHPPDEVTGVGYLDWLAIEGLLLGDDQHVLYDPQHAIWEAKRGIRARTSYEAIARRTVAVWMREMDALLTHAREALAHGNLSDAIWKSADVARWARGTLTTLGRHKELAVAAQRVGVDELPPPVRELLAMEAPPKQAVAAKLAAAEDLWRYSVAQAWDAILSRLVAAGVDRPLKIKLVGDYNLFWRGERLHELGRVPAEVEYSFRASHCELERDNAAGANGVLGFCGTSDEITGRWAAIAKALAAHGHDVSPIVGALLASAEYQRLAAALDRANDAVQPSVRTPAEATHAVELATAVRDMVARVANWRNA
jgi:predicted nucleotidyltransferase